MDRVNLIKGENMKADELLEQQKVNEVDASEYVRDAFDSFEDVFDKVDAMARKYDGKMSSALKSLKSDLQKTRGILS